MGERLQTLVRRARNATSLRTLRLSSEGLTEVRDVLFAAVHELAVQGIEHLGGSPEHDDDASGLYA